MNKGTAKHETTPTNLLPNMRNKLNVGKKYHSGSISTGVENAFEGLLKPKGSKIASNAIKETVPMITTGNTYRMSLGQAGSP